MQEFSAFAADQWPLFLAAVVITALIIRSYLQPKLSGIKTIDTTEAIRMINNDAVVLDVRLENEFKTGHIEHAIHIPVGALESRIRELEKYKSKAIVVNCQSGNRSQTAARILKKHGFENIYNLGGGIGAWINASLPISKNTRR